MIQSVSAILPPLNLQREFAAFIEQLDKSLFAVNKLIEQYDRLYRAKRQEECGWTETASVMSNHESHFARA